MSTQPVITNMEGKPAERQVKRDALGRSKAIGRRKNARARVTIKLGTGKITVNKHDIKEYFGRETLRMIVNQPFGATHTENRFDVIVTTDGGGLSGQAG